MYYRSGTDGKLPLSCRADSSFLPRDASAERGYEIACRPSVRNV